jgi:serine/threonine protein kinase
MDQSSSGNKRYVLKPVSPAIYGLLKEIKHEFCGNTRLRLHIDHNDKEQTLVYEYFRTDLLALVKNCPEMSVQARKSILQEVGLALRDMHSKDWIHLGTKP